MVPEESIGPLIEKFQRIEITEHHIYKRLARSIKDPENSEILDQIAEDELRHYDDWKKYTQREIKPNMWDVWKYYLPYFWVYVWDQINGKWGGKSPGKLFASDWESP